MKVYKLRTRKPKGLTRRVAIENLVGWGETEERAKQILVENPEVLLRSRTDLAFWYMVRGMEQTVTIQVDHTSTEPANPTLPEQGGVKKSDTLPSLESSPEQAQVVIPDIQSVNQGGL